MRTDGGNPPGDLFAAPGDQRLQKALADLLEAKLGAGDRRIHGQRVLPFRAGQGIVGRLVSQAQHFIAAGQLVMEARPETLQFLNGVYASEDDLPAAQRQEVIPIIQLLGIASPLAKLLEQRVALAERAEYAERASE